jgi:nicotinamidase/pyrazinamidase
MSTLYLDIDTQLDFVYPAGALYAPGAERIVPVIAELHRAAVQSGITVLSTVDAHAEDDPEFKTWPKHCVAGTLGQQKVAATLLPRRLVVPNVAGPVSIEGVDQIIVEKQTTDAFLTRTLAGILDRLHADEYVVYGVVTEICVLQAVRGLLKRGKPVRVLANAIQALTAEGSESALSEMRAAGVTVE